MWRTYEAASSTRGLCQLGKVLKQIGVNSRGVPDSLRHKRLHSHYRRYARLSDCRCGEEAMNRLAGPPLLTGTRAVNPGSQKTQQRIHQL